MVCYLQLEDCSYIRYLMLLIYITYDLLPIHVFNLLMKLHTISA